MCKFNDKFLVNKVPNVGLFCFSCDYSNYLDQVAEEINDTLQESGQVIISELSKTFTLSTDFLLEVRTILNS